MGIARFVSATERKEHIAHAIQSISLRDAVAAYEKDLISDALKTTRGNRAKAARLLNTTERIINYQVKKYSIDYRRFKN